MNVRINLGGLKDEKVKSDLSRESCRRSARESEARFKRDHRRSSRASSARQRSLAVLHASQLVTLAGPKRPRVGRGTGRARDHPDGGMLVEEGVIVAVGPSDEIEQAIAERRRK